MQPDRKPKPNPKPNADADPSAAPKPARPSPAAAPGPGSGSAARRSTPRPPSPMGSAPHAGPSAGAGPGQRPQSGSAQRGSSGSGQRSPSGPAPNAGPPAGAGSGERAAHPRLDPLAGVDHVVVDGTNLLHALRRGGMPAAALIGRVRAIIPAATSIELVFDGTPDRGMRRERVASGLMVTYSWPRTADAAILDRLAGLDAEAADHLLVVTDDRDLRGALGARGARTARSAWLLGRLSREVAVAPVVGNARRPPAPPAGSGAGRRLEVDKDDGSGPRWAPGRGATAKSGNGRKSPRAGRRAAG